MDAAPAVMWQCEIEDHGLVWSKFRKAFVPAAGQHHKPVEELAKEFWFFKEAEVEDVCRALAGLGVTSQSVKYSLDDEDNQPSNESGETDDTRSTDGAAGQAGARLPAVGP